MEQRILNKVPKDLCTKELMKALLTFKDNPYITDELYPRLRFKRLHHPIAEAAAQGFTIFLKPTTKRRHIVHELMHALNYLNPRYGRYTIEPYLWYHRDQAVYYFPRLIYILSHPRELFPGITEFACCEKHLIREIDIWLSAIEDYYFDTLGEYARLRKPV